MERCRGDYKSISAAVEAVPANQTGGSISCESVSNSVGIDIQPDEVVHFGATELQQCLLSREQSSFRVEHLEVADDALAIARTGELRNLPLCHAPRCCAATCSAR